MEDFQLISQIAKDYFKSRHDIPSDIKDPRSREIYTRDHMTIAFNLLLAIGDAVEFKNMMTALAADPLVDADHFIDPFHSLAPQIAEPMLFISKANADNLRPIGLEAIRNSRPNLRQKYVDFFRGLNQFFKETGNDVVVQSESQMGGQREDPFKPEQERVAEALKYGQGSSPKKLQAFRDKGQELLARGVYWDACFMFTAARDIKGLRQLYQVIVTTQGAPKRYLSYVTAAMIMIGAEE
jgi:hypothetical protein